jgi:hypothetical protein
MQTENNFNVGDKVRVVKATGSDFWYKNLIGQEFIVNELTSFELGKGVMVEGHMTGMMCEDLELVKSPKSLLKDGMRVKFRNGETGMFLNNVFVAHGSWISSVQDRNDQLDSAGWYDDYDVVAIYNLPKDERQYLSLEHRGSLVWGREAKPLAPVKTEAQKKLEELEATIAAAQKQAAELKAEMEGA